MPTGKFLAPALLFWLALTSLNASHCQAQNLRAATASSYIERGNEWFTKGEYARAEADFTLAIATDPNQAAAYCNRATTRYQMGKLQEALTDFDRVLQREPRLVEAYVGRGGVRYVLGDFDGVISDSNKAIELNPAQAQSWNNRGLARGGKGADAGALADFDRAVKLDPRNAEIYNNRGVVRFRLKDYGGNARKSGRAPRPISPSTSRSTRNTPTLTLHAGLCACGKAVRPTRGRISSNA